MSLLLLLAPLALRPSHAADGWQSPCTAGNLYQDWLSAPEVFVRTDQRKGLQGLHVACVWRGRGGAADGEEGPRLEAYKDALDTGAPETHVLPKDAEATWSAFRSGLENALQITKVTSNWGHWDLKQVFGVFRADGTRLRSVAAALDAQLLFIVVGGQWFWPPVREGFVRQLDGGSLALETLSVQPTVYKVRGFLKDGECEEVRRLGRSRMHVSPVSLMDKDKTKAAKDFRTSTQARVDRDESETLRSIDVRVSRLTHVSASHNEEVQILNYEKTQYYSAHLDNWDPSFYSDSAWFEHGHNNRYITVFWYLSNVEKGGQTIFPRAYGLPQPHDMWSCEKGLKVNPEQGTVVFWYSLHPNGNTDPNGLHAACPVEAGHKWSANYWVWNKPKNLGPHPGAVFDEFDAAAMSQESQEPLKEAQRLSSASPTKSVGPVVFVVGTIMFALVLVRFAPRAGPAPKTNKKKKKGWHE